MLRVVLVGALVALTLAAAPSQDLLNEWSQFQADDDFFNEFESFLQTGSTTAGGDFEFKCETTCQLVQQNTDVSAETAARASAAARAANSFLQTEEARGLPQAKMQKQVEEAFYKTMDSFLETSATTTAGDFEFKCATTCQLVQSDTGAAAPSGTTTTTTPTSSDSGEGATRHASNAAARHTANLLETESGVNLQVESTATTEAKTSTMTAQAKDCYRLCLNPSMNPGCDAAAEAVSMLEMGSTTEAEVMKKNWSMGHGSGNCLNSCVHVCMAVHESQA